LKIHSQKPLTRCAAALLIVFGLTCEPAAGQASKMSNMQNLVCHYSPEQGELSLALLALGTATHPRQSYAFRDELEVKLEIDADKSVIIDRASLKVAVLGDYRSAVDRKYTLFRFNIIMDESGSIQMADLDAARKTIQRFLEKIPVTFEVQLVRFTNQVSVATGFTNNLTTFLAALNAPRLEGDTAFYDAFDQGMKELIHAAGTSVPLRFMIAFTDGADNASTRFADFADFKQKIQLQAEREQVFMFIAGIGTGNGTESGIQHHLLEQIPGKMGIYYPLQKVPDVDQLFEQVANALDRTYIVRIPIVSSHRGTKTVYILRRKSSGGHDVVQDIPLPPSCTL
jgi:hypothetical protein